MKRNLKTGYIVVVFLLLLAGLAGTAHATVSITNPSSCPAPPPLTSGNVGVSYTQYTFVAVGAGGTPAWSVVSGLPPGLTLSSGGVLSGTPTTVGTYTFPVTVAKEVGGLGLASCSCTVVVIGSGCNFDGTNIGVISFGNIDPSSAGPINNIITTPVNFKCASGTTYTITYTSAQTLSGTKNSIPFTLSLAAGDTSNSSTTDISLLTTASQILAANYQNAYAETDNSTTNVTINWTGNTGSPIYATVNAGGTVLNTCAVTGSPALNFGTLDAATNAGGATATVTSPSIVCTMGDPVNVTSNGGLNYSGTPRLTSGSYYINYNFSFAGSFLGAGATMNIGGNGTGNLNMGATIPAGALDNAPAGTYTDTITLTISY